MNSDHEFYEAQSVLAAAGQLTDTELAELERHADACRSCRRCLTDMAEISRELFVAQAGKLTNRRAPARMQNRFLVRAAQSGILMPRSTPEMAGAPLVGVAALAAVLAVAAFSGWRHPSAPTTERAAASTFLVEENKPILALKTNAPIVDARPWGDELAHKVRFRQRSGVRRRMASIVSEDRNNDMSSNFSVGHNLWSDGIRTGQLTALTYTPIRKYAQDNTVAAFFGRGDDSKPEERTFHLDPKLASLSFLEFPQNRDVGLDTIHPAFVIPAFHLNNKSIW